MVVTDVEVAVVVPVVALSVVCVVVVDVCVVVVLLVVDDSVDVSDVVLTVLVFVRVVQNPHDLSHMPANWLLHSGQNSRLHVDASQSLPAQATSQKISPARLMEWHSVPLVTDVVVDPVVRLVDVSVSVLSVDDMVKEDVVVAEVVMVVELVIDDVAEVVVLSAQYLHVVSHMCICGQVGQNIVVQGSPHCKASSSHVS
jgi:hypothetical protein